MKSNKQLVALQRQLQATFDEFMEQLEQIRQKRKDIIAQAIKKAEQNKVSLIKGKIKNL